MVKKAKPKSLEVEPVTAWAIRGPTKNNPEWYWRAVAHEGGERWDVWVGRGSRETVKGKLLDLVRSGAYREGRPKKAPAAERPIVLWQLIRDWTDAEKTRANLEDSTIQHNKAHGEGLIYRKAGRRKKETWDPRNWGTVKLMKLDDDDVQGFVNERLAERAAPRTIQAELDVLSKAWAWGRKRGYCADRDLAFPELAATCTRAKRVPTPGEVAAVFRRLPPAFALVCLLLYVSGMRIGEIAGLTWERVLWHDDGSVELRLVGKNRKKYETGYRRVWLLPEQAKDAIEELRRWKARAEAAAEDGTASGTVHGYTEKSMKSHYGRKLWDACEAAEVDYWTPGGHRRAMVHVLFESGTDPLSYEAHMDHSWKVGKDIYAQKNAIHERKAAAKVKPLPAGDVIDLQQAREDRAKGDAHT